MRVILMLAIAFAATLAAETTDPATQPKELGAVHWQRNLDEAAKLAKAESKPMFVQFQEVPG